MSKCYPAIFYPPLIIKFLANNLNPTFSGYYPYPNKTSSQSPKNQASSSYAVPPKKLLSLCYLVIFISFTRIIFLSFAFLSPLWLVAALWVFIGLGILCFLLPLFSKKLSNKNISYKHQGLTVVKANTFLHSPQREAKLKKLVARKVLQPIGRSDAPAGVSEKAFYQVIGRIFPEFIQGVAFHNPKFSHPYSADFVLVHKSSLSIDIEIDEPYVGDTKAPHHCIDQGKDDIRNQFFTSNNWVVIRFSEKQAVKYPYSCCKAIASVIARVAGDYTFLTRLQKVSDLPPDPMWTIKQAKKWAMFDYRKTYLP